MFETSFLLFIKYLLLNIIVPFVPGLLFLRIFYGKKLNGILLYLLSRFIGVGVVAFSLLNIQFIHFGVGIIEYFIILGILILALIGKICFKKQSIKDYIQTLKIENIIPKIKESFTNLSLTEKVFTTILSIFSLYFIIITGIFNFNLPTYADDSFGNRDKPAYNIYTDGGIKLFGDESEILARGRFGYPIHIPTYKTLISQFAGGINDIYFNTWQRLVFLFGMIFLFVITFDKTKNIFKSALPLGLICSLPLVFFHTFEGYMELPSIFYCIISVWLFYKYFEEKDFDYFSLGLLFGFILSYIKNDGFIVYFPGILITVLLFLIIKKDLTSTIKGFFKDKENLRKSIGFFIYFFIPFLLVKMIHGLGFNQAAGETSGIGLSNTTHREIFSQFPNIFLGIDNYNIVLILIIFLTVSTAKKKGKNENIFFILGLILFLIIIAVFLFTENYIFVMDQTTVNRVITMIFVLIIGFWGFISND